MFVTMKFTNPVKLKFTSSRAILIELHARDIIEIQ